MIGLSGLMSRMRGDRLKAEKKESKDPLESDEITILDVSDYNPRRILSPTWREYLKKIREVDPLGCIKCHE